MTRKWMKTMGLIGIVAMSALFMVGSVAQAQGPTGHHHGMGMGGFNGSLVAVAADAFKMEPADLITLLQSGKTIADVAKDKGVEIETIVTAFVAERETFVKQAVELKRMTQEQADLMLKGLREQATIDIAKPWTPNMGMNQGGGMAMMDSDDDGMCDLCGMSMGMNSRRGHSPMMGRGGRGMGMGR